MLTLNGLSVLGSPRLVFPRTGAWHAEDVRVDTTDEINGAVTLNLDEGRMVLSGTVIRGGNWQDTGHLRIVGGAGGLRRIAKPKHYTSATVRVVLGDLLATGGERLSVTADPLVISKDLPAWTTAALPIGRLITQLLLSAFPSATWRVLTDGSVWVGREGWPDSGLSESDFQVLSEDPSKAEAVIGMETPVIMPGTRLGARRVSYVEHTLGEQTRSVVQFETGGADDRLKAALRGVVKAAQAPIDYLSHYFATVVSQSGGKIDVKPIDARIPSMAGVPLYCGFPDWKVEVSPGGRVLIGWSGGDPTQPYAEAFSPDTSVTLIRLGPSATAAGVAREGDSTKLVMYPPDILALAAALLATGVFLPSGSTPTPPAAPLPFEGGVITSGSETIQAG